MAPYATLNDLVDSMDKSAKEQLHEDMQVHFVKVLKACTHHKSYALPKPEFLEEDQGTEDANVIKAVEIADEIIAIALGQIEALKWDLVGELLNPGAVVSQAFKKACYLRYEHLSNSEAPSLLGLAQLIEQKEKLKRKSFAIKADNDVELNLPVLAKKRKYHPSGGVSGQGLTGDLSPGPGANPLADDSLLKRVNEMTAEEMAAELKQRGLKCSGIKVDLMNRLKAARCQAYHPEEAAWANGLTDQQLVTLARQSAIDIKGGSREKLKVYLYENPNLKSKLEAELEVKIKKDIKPVIDDNKKHPSIPGRPKLATTTEEPRYQRRLILLNFPKHTTERDITTLMAQYGGRLPIKQGPGEFLVDCDTAANAKRAVADMRFQLVEGRMTRCVLEVHYIQEKKKAEADKKTAKDAK